MNSTSPFSPPSQAKPRFTRRRLFIIALQTAIAVAQLPIFLGSAGTWRAQSFRSRMVTKLDNELAALRSEKRKGAA